MKKLFIPALTLVLAGGMVACKKDNSDVQNNITASKSSDVKKGEAVVFTYSGSQSGSSVNWSVSPSAGTLSSFNGNTAVFRFSNAGDYTVSAAVAGSTYTARVTVINQRIDTTGGGSPGTPVPIAAGDKIKIFVQKVSADTLSNVLQFSAQTQNQYNCLNNYLVSEVSSGPGSFTINYAGVMIPASCTSGSVQAGAFTGISPLSAGNNTLSVKVRGVTYTGGIQKNGNNYTISWPDTSAVIMSPLSL